MPVGRVRIPTDPMFDGGKQVGLKMILMIWGYPLVDDHLNRMENHLLFRDSSGWKSPSTGGFSIARGPCCRDVMSSEELPPDLR